MVAIEDTVEAVEAVQRLETSALARELDLGRTMNLSDAVEPMTRVVDFFKQIPVIHLPDLSKGARDRLRNSATNVLSFVEQLNQFDPAGENANQTRQQLIQQAQTLPDNVFDEQHNTLSFLASRQRDFSALAAEARDARDKATAEAEGMKSDLAAAQIEAKHILDELRKTAAEQGISQLATYFRDEAGSHDTAAANWQKYTVYTAIGLGTFALISLAAGFWFLKPDTAYEAFQIGLSKVLIFSTIAYMLFLCARTLTAHRHNAVVNRHRQNALLTFNAFVDATTGEATRDAVLNHAAACVFAPQDSGFNRSAANVPASPIVELLPKALQSSHG